MVSRGSALVRWVIPGLLVGLSALLSGCVVGAGDETAGETESAAQSPLNEGVTLPDPTLPGDPGAGEDPEPDPWKGGRTNETADPEPDPWNPQVAVVKPPGTTGHKP